MEGSVSLRTNRHPRKGIGLFHPGVLDYEQRVVGKIETLLILLALVGILAVLSTRLRVSFPIMMVIGGVVLALIPGLPHVSLDPDLVLYVFLPPMIYSAAFAFPWDEMVANMRGILALAVGLVLATMTCVAFAAYWVIPGLPLAAAFVLGAIVSPPDAVAATAVLDKMRVPQRVSTLLEGESLVNDSTGLVAYAFAVSAVVTGSFSLAAAVGDFVWMSIGGVALGLLVGWLVGRVHQQIREPGAGMILQLLTPYAAYLPAEKLGVSGVLAAVAAGLYLGRHALQVLNVATRVNGEAIWGFLNFVLNGAVFILIGLEFPVIMEGLQHNYAWGELLLYGGLVSLVVVAVRFAWVFSLSALYRRLAASSFGSKSSLGMQMVVSWAGMRGAVSLAAALAIPTLMASGEPFPARNLLLFLTYSVIFATLVFQGFTLPWIVRKFGVEEATSDFDREVTARKDLLGRAVAMIDEEVASSNSRLSPDAARILREHFDSRLDHLSVKSGSRPFSLTSEELAFLHRIMNDSRMRLEELRREGAIPEKTRRELALEIDMEEQRLRRVLYRL